MCWSVLGGARCVGQCWAGLGWHPRSSFTINSIKMYKEMLSENVQTLYLFAN